MASSRPLCLAYACVFVLAIFSEHATANENPEIKHIEKRSVSFDDWKRAGQAAGYMNELESALGTMQRPRFGKRFLRDDFDEYLLMNEKRGNGVMDLESALGSMQRPRFGRRR